MRNALVLLVALCACTPQITAPTNGTPAVAVPDTAGKPLVAKPAQVQFALGGLIAPPQVVHLKSSAPLTPGFIVSVADPTQAGVSDPTLSGPRSAAATFYPISIGEHGGQTTVMITNINTPLVGVSVPVTQQACGRPDNLVHADLIYPPIGTKTTTRVGALYFAVYSSVAPTSRYPMNLHLIVDKTGTAEGSALSKAAPPPGAVVPTPPPGPFVTTDMRGTVPKLPRGVTIRTQVYDDTCQQPVLAGAFKTK